MWSDHVKFLNPHYNSGKKYNLITPGINNVLIIFAWFRRPIICMFKYCIPSASGRAIGWNHVGRSNNLCRNLFDNYFSVLGQTFQIFKAKGL